ncbi:MAG TPA: DUF805 domain-containing protein [Hyphomicrobiales bacterium]|nr:DUF805 domain-containing protein [Rhodobiaceae bacterium]HXK54055.1 DUF805 domain-containing protein [Hyphomicrobiales bacterium]
MNSIRAFLTSGERITRRQFWLAHLFILGATVCFSLIAGLFIGVLSTLPGLAILKAWGPAIIGGTVGLIALGAEMIVAIKRMHDRGASGLWVIGVMIAAFGANMVIGGQLVHSGANPITPLTVGLTVFTTIMGGWLILELGFLRGTEGENRFGGDPLGGRTAHDEAGEEPLLLSVPVSASAAGR